MHERDHPLRRRLTDEVHARPIQPLTAPLRASHLAMLTAGVPDSAEREHLATLCAGLAAPPPPAETDHFSLDLGLGRLRWERHTEFSTYTLFRPGPFAEPFDDHALALLPADWLDGLPGQRLVAVHLALDTTEQDHDRLEAAFTGHVLAGSQLLGGAARGWSDYRIHRDGFGRVLVEDCGLTAGQGGRLVQRLLEIETYRMMALLAFPAAREVGQTARQIDQDLAGMVARLAAPPCGDPGDDRRLLDRLTGLAAECERMTAATSYRFSAARAYYAIVRSRIDELREDRIPGTQTIAEFMDRRLAPAMKTCEAMAELQDGLARRVARAADLLRTRVDIALEEKNRDLLASMNRRAHQQLRLQETVEGLSVVAISYYLLGLVGYLAKGAKAAGLRVDPDIAVMIGLPLVLGMVWLGVRRLRRALGHNPAH